MDDPAASDRNDGLNGLVRPYVTGGITPRDTVPLPPLDDATWYQPAPAAEQTSADPPPARHRRPADAAGRKLPFVAMSRKWLLTLAEHRRSIGIGAAAGIVALAGCMVFLILPHSAPGVLASRCQSDSCSATRVPVTASPRTFPSSDAPGARPARQITGQLPGQSATVAAARRPATSPAAKVTADSPSPTPTSTQPSLTPGSWISIRATTACCTTFYIRHDDGDNGVVITQITSGSSATTKTDATWIVRSGLADSSCISFESANEPGKYLRHYDFELRLDPDNGSWQFAQDATFCPRAGNSGQDYSFESVNYPAKYIRHFNYVVYIASDGGSNPWDTPTLWPDDSTWAVSQPWG